MKSKKIFLICPVRGANDKLTKRIGKYVKELEKQGHEVYWPYRDTDQSDPIGLRICTDNGWGIFEANEIRIWWLWQKKKWWQKLMWWIKEKRSTGSLFDVGMTFMLVLLFGKKVILANPDEVKPTKGKSFENVLLALHKENTKGGKG